MQTLLGMIFFFLSANNNEIKWDHFRDDPTLIQQNRFSQRAFPSTYRPKDLLLSISSQSIIKET